MARTRHFFDGMMMMSRLENYLLDLPVRFKVEFSAFSNITVEFGVSKPRVACKKNPIHILRQLYVLVNIEIISP